MTPAYDAVILTDFHAGQPERHNRALGAYHIAHILRERGLKVFVLDFFFSYSGDEAEELARKLISRRTRFIGISTTWISSTVIQLNRTDGEKSAEILKRFILAAKGINQSIRVIKGGSYQYFNEKLVDHHVPGQYVENTFLELLNTELGLELPADYEFESHRFEFHEHDFVVRGEPLPVEVSRGCIFNCKFCGFYGRGKNKNESIKSFELIGEFLRSSHEKHGTEYFYLADDTFNESVEKMQAFADRVASLDFKPRFCCYARLELLMKFPEMLDIARKAGVIGITLGIETFNEKAARAIGKSSQAERIKAFLQKIRADYPEFHLSSGFIAGLPHEELDSCQATNDWLRESRVLNSWSFNPLYLDNSLSNPFASEFSKSIEKYGYTRLGASGWERPGLTFLDAARFSHFANEENKPFMNASAWNLFTLASRRGLESVRALSAVEYDRLLDREKFHAYKGQLFDFLKLS